MINQGKPRGVAQIHGRRIEVVLKILKVITRNGSLKV